MNLLGLVFLIYGDSVTIQTRESTRAALITAGAAEVRYLRDYPEFLAAENLPANNDNGGDSDRALRFFLTQDLSDVDYVILNTGLHDMVFSDTTLRTRQVPEERYEKNLRDIRTSLGGKLIWRETFPTYNVPDGERRDKDDIDRYNLIARYALPGVLRVAQFPILPEEHSADGIHLIEPSRVGGEVARQIVSGEVRRFIQLSVGTLLRLEVPSIITVDPETLGATVIAK